MRGDRNGSVEPVGSRPAPGLAPLQLDTLDKARVLMFTALHAVGSEIFW